MATRTSPASLIIVPCTATSYGQQCPAAHNPRSTATPDHVAHLNSWLFRNRPCLSVVSACPTGKALRSRARCMQCVSALHADRAREDQATRSSCVFSMRACLFDNNVCMCKRVVESLWEASRELSMQATAPSCSCEGARRHSTKYVLKWHNEKLLMLVWV